MGVVIDPVRLHRDSYGKAGKVFAHASYIFELARWRARWRKAEELKDYDKLDRLDREYEMIGLP